MAVTVSWAARLKSETNKMQREWKETQIPVTRMTSCRVKNRVHNWFCYILQVSCGFSLRMHENTVVETFSNSKYCFFAALFAFSCVTTDSHSGVVCFSSVFLFRAFRLLLNADAGVFQTISELTVCSAFCPNPLFFRVFGTLSRDRLILSGSPFLIRKDKLSELLLEEKKKRSKTQVWLMPAAWTEASVDKGGCIICGLSCTWSNKCCCRLEDDSFCKQILIHTCLDSYEACHPWHRPLSPTFVEAKFHICVLFRWKSHFQPC